MLRQHPRLMVVARESTGDQPSTAPSAASDRDVSGTNFQSISATIARSIAGSSGGAATGYSSRSGPSCWRNAQSSELYIGAGKQQTADSAKLDSVGKTWGKTLPIAPRTA